MTKHPIESRNGVVSAGFTLVELMVVLVILAVGMLPLALVQTRAQQDVFEAGQFTTAVNLAQLQMESTKSVGFANAISDSGMTDGVYNWNTQVTPVSIGLNQITVTVTWNEKGNQRNIALTNLISVKN